MPRPNELPFAVGAEYSEPNSQGDYAAIYDNPIASPTTREQLIDFNDNSANYLDLCSDQKKPEGIYDNPMNMALQMHREQAAPASPGSCFVIFITHSRSYVVHLYEACVHLFQK